MNLVVELLQCVLNLLYGLSDTIGCLSQNHFSYTHSLGLAEDHCCREHRCFGGQGTSLTPPPGDFPGCRLESERRHGIVGCAAPSLDPPGGRSGSLGIWDERWRQGAWMKQREGRRMDGYCFTGIA